MSFYRCIQSWNRNQNHDVDNFYLPKIPIDINCIFTISYTGNHIICCLLCLCSFTYQNVFEILQCYYMFTNVFIILISRLIAIWFQLFSVKLYLILSSWSGIQLENTNVFLHNIQSTLFCSILCYSSQNMWNTACSKTASQNTNLLL